MITNTRVITHYTVDIPDTRCVLLNIGICYKLSLPRYLISVVPIISVSVWH